MERLHAEFTALWLIFGRDESCTQQIIQRLSEGLSTRSALLLYALDYILIERNRGSDAHDVSIA
jgi:hypothetical protein